MPNNVLKMLPTKAGEKNIYMILSVCTLLLMRIDVFKSKAISHDMRFPEIKLDSIPVHTGLCSGNLLSDFRLLRQQFI